MARPEGFGRAGTTTSPRATPVSAIADALLAYSELGFSEVRLDVRVPSDVPRTEAIAWMQEVVARVHA